MEDFRAIIVKWPEPHVETLAADVGASREAVKKWWQRNAIPGEWFAHVRDAAARRRIKGVTTDLMAELARRQAA
jgi:hypothetical protein